MRPSKPRSFFDKLNDWAREQGAGGLGYIPYAAEGPKGPIAKNLDEARLAKIRDAAGLKDGDAVFFACDKKAAAEKFAGAVRTRLGDELGPDRAECVPVLLDRRFPDVRAEPGHRQDRVQPQPVLDAAGRPRGAEHAGIR